MAYQLFYKELSLTEEHNYDVTTYKNITVYPNLTSFIITNLDQYREYSIYLATVNDIGVGAMDHKIQRTGPGGKISVVEQLSTLEEGFLTIALGYKAWSYAQK